MRYSQIIPFQVGDARTNKYCYQFKCIELEAKIETGLKFLREDSKLIDGNIKLNLGGENKLNDASYDITFLHSYDNPTTINELKKIIAVNEFDVYGYSIERLKDGTEETRHIIQFYKQRAETSKPLIRNIVKKSDDGYEFEKMSFGFKLLRPFWEKVEAYTFDSTYNPRIFNEASTRPFSEASAVPFNEFPEWTTNNLLKIGKELDLSDFVYITSFSPYLGEKTVFGAYSYEGNFASDKFLIRFNILANQSITFASGKYSLTFKASLNNYTSLVFDSTTQTIKNGSVLVLDVVTNGYLKISDVGLLTASNSAVTYSIIITNLFLC